MCRWASTLVLLAACASRPDAAELHAPFLDNRFFYQRNTDGSSQWQEEPRVFLPWRLDNGWSFTQRIDLPLVYTNASGRGNPGGGYSFGLGDFFIEEIFDSPKIARDLRVTLSVRFVFPTGKQGPFGSSQYQWAPAAGLTWRVREGCDCVTLVPLVRYSSGFAAKYANVQEIRNLDVYPAAEVDLGKGWYVGLYPENPISYNAARGTWFVPVDLMLGKRVSRDFEFGIGGAFRVGNSADPLYSYLVNGRIIYKF